MPIKKFLGGTVYAVTKPVRASGFVAPGWRVAPTGGSRVSTHIINPVGVSHVKRSIPGKEKALKYRI